MDEAVNLGVMGDANAQAGVQQASAVNIDRAFRMATTEITNEQYRVFDPSHDNQLVRGDSWYDRPIRARSSFRLGCSARQGINDVGFRVICDSAPSKAANDRNSIHQDTLQGIKSHPGTQRPPDRLGFASRLRSCGHPVELSK